MMDAKVLTKIASYLSNQLAFPQTENRGAEAEFIADKSLQQEIEPKVHIIIFSKDRPFQLTQLLVSVHKHLDFDEIDRKITVIFTTSSIEFFQCYEQMMEVFPTVNFVKEQIEKKFILQLIEVVESPDKQCNKGLVMFAVDDMIVYADPPFRLKWVHETINEQNELFGVHLKLNPSIFYSHCIDDICEQPIFELIKPDFAATPIHVIREHEEINFDAVEYKFGNDAMRRASNILKFKRIPSRKRMKSEWCYPFDLTGGIYRCGTVLSILQHIICNSGDECMNPNIFEVYGNNIIERNSVQGLSEYTEMGCLSRPILSVVSINRVQDTYSNPVYSVLGGNVSSLIDSFRSGKSFNRDLYRAKYFSRVHIKEFNIIGADSILKIQAESVQLPQISVILPFRNAAATLQDSIQSILNQSFQWFELILVNDGSTDNYKNIVAKFIERDSRVHLVEGNARRGLSSALNIGIRCAKCEFIARMDADDICASNRLQILFDYMSSRPDIFAVGSAAISFNIDEGKISLQRYIYYPSSNHLLKWAMLFSCCLVHPTVMFRKAAVVRAGGYLEEEEPAEDYGLWLRILYDCQQTQLGKSKNSVAAISSIPEPLLFLRKHSRNSSLINRKRQRSTALELSQRAISQYLGKNIEMRIVEVLSFRSETQSVADSYDAGTVLIDLMKEAIKDIAHLEESEHSKMIRKDAQKRLAMLVNMSLKKFGPEAQCVLNIFAENFHVDNVQSLELVAGNIPQL